MVRVEEEKGSNVAMSAEELIVESFSGNYLNANFLFGIKNIFVSLFLACKQNTFLMYAKEYQTLTKLEIRR